MMMVATARALVKRRRPTVPAQKRRSANYCSVPFDDRGWTNLGVIRILSELAPRVPLAKQIPTLIELDLDGFEPYLIMIGQVALPVEMLLLVDKTFDFLQDRLIGRRFSHVHHLALAQWFDLGSDRASLQRRDCGPAHPSDSA